MHKMTGQAVSDGAGCNRCTMLGLCGEELEGKTLD